MPVGRGDNTLSSVSDQGYRHTGGHGQTQTVVDSAVITDIRVQLAKVDLMERVKICFIIIPQHQDRCLSGTVG